MATRDPEKRLAAGRRYRLKKKIEKYGIENADVNMSGRHGNHARGSASSRWNPGPLKSSHGYVMLRVPPDHHLAFGPPLLKRFKYAYEHDLVMEEKLGRCLAEDEIVHHVNGQRDDNRPENLEVETRSDHAREHGNVEGIRDEMGRFSPGIARTRSHRSEFPR